MTLWHWIKDRRFRKRIGDQVADIAKRVTRLEQDQRFTHLRMANVENDTTANMAALATSLAEALKIVREKK